MKKSLLFPLGILCLLFVAFTPIMSSPGKGDWRAVTAEDLKLTADQVGKDTDAAILFKETYIDDSDSDGVGFQVYERIKIFTERGLDYATRHVKFDKGERIKDIKARTIKPDGSIIELKKEDIFEKTLFKLGSDQEKEKTFTLPAVTPGCIIEYRYRRSTENSGRFDIDIQQEMFAREVKVYLKPFDYPGAGMKWLVVNPIGRDQYLQSKKEDGWVIIKAENIPGLKEEPYSPPSHLHKTWGLLWYTAVTESNPDKYWANYSSSRGDDVKSFCGRNKEIKKLVPTLISQSDSDEVKARKLYEYVQHEVKNTIETLVEAIEAGQDIGKVKLKFANGADDVLKAKTGTYEEIDKLYVSMLQAAGLDAYIARVCTRNKDVFRKSLTEGFQFNDELIAVKKADGKYTFYDPSTTFAPFGYLSWEKQGITALILDKKGGEFTLTPVLAPNSNLSLRSAEVLVDSNGSVTGEGKIEYTGESAISFKHDFQKKSPEERVTYWRGQFAEKIANFTSKDEQIQNIDDPANPLTTTFKFQLPNYVGRTGKRMLLQPAIFNRSQKSLFPTAGRVNDIYFHHPWSEHDHVVITIPEGYSVEQLPEPIVLNGGPILYKQTFKVEGRKIVFDRELNINVLNVPAQSYPQLKNFFDQVYQADQYTVSLRQAATGSN